VEGFSKLVSDFIEAGRSFLFYFFHKKDKIMNPIKAHLKRTVLIFRTFKKFHLEALSLAGHRAEFRIQAF
jgi:hypothetical protein